MAIKLTLSQLVMAVEGAAIKNLEAADIPWDYRMTCARLTAEVFVEYTRFAKLRLALIKEHGGKETEQNTIVIAHAENTPEAIQAYHDKLAALLDSSVELHSKPLSLGKLGERCGLSTADLRLLDPLLTD